MHKPKTVEVEYIEKGTFVGGEEESFGLLYDEAREGEYEEEEYKGGFIVMRKKDFDQMKDAAWKYGELSK